MERVFLNINQTNRELNRKIKQYLKQQTVRGQVRDLRVLARALTDVTLLVPVTVSDSDRRTSSSGYTYVIGTPDVQRQQGYTCNPVVVAHQGCQSHTYTLMTMFVGHYRSL